MFKQMCCEPISQYPAPATSLHNNQGRGSSVGQGFAILPCPNIPHDPTPHSYLTPNSLYRTPHPTLQYPPFTVTSPS